MNDFFIRNEIVILKEERLNVTMMMGKPHPDPLMVRLPFTHRYSVPSQLPYTKRFSYLHLRERLNDIQRNGAHDWDEDYMLDMYGYTKIMDDDRKTVVNMSESTWKHLDKKVEDYVFARLDAILATLK